MICSDVWRFVEFDISAIDSFPPIHLRFKRWLLGSHQFQKLIMRFQPFKLKNGYGSVIILAATTSAITTSKGKGKDDKPPEFLGK